MGIAVATFAVVMGLILATYWVALVRPEDRAQTTLRKRLKTRGSAAAVRLDLVKKVERLSHVPVLNKLLARTAGVSNPLRRLITESGVAITPGLLLLMSAFAGLLAYVVVQTLTHQFLIGVVCGALAAGGPYLYVCWVRVQRLRKFEETFPEAIDLIARALRAGHAFTTGIGMVANELPAPVGAEFRLLYDGHHYGQPLALALRAFAERVPLIDARFFATAVLTQRESGGNLTEVLDNLATVIRERFRVKRQVRVITAHGRITGMVLVALPPCMAFAMYTSGPENFTPLFTDPIGIQMVTGAIILQVIGTLIIKKLVNIEY